MATKWHHLSAYSLRDHSYSSDVEVDSASMDHRELPAKIMDHGIQVLLHVKQMKVKFLLYIFFLLDISAAMVVLSYKRSSFFQNEEIFVQLDELDELDRITHA